MDSNKVRIDLVSLKKLYGLLQHYRFDATSPIHLDEKAQILLKDVLNDAAKPLLDAHSKIQEEKKSYGMESYSQQMASPDPADGRTKLQRADSCDISKAFPVLVRSLSKAASNVFTFTTKKEEQSPARASKEISSENPKHPVTVSRPAGTSHVRCQVCKRPRIARAVSSREVKPRNIIQWPPAGNDRGVRGSPFSVGSVNLMQPEPKIVSGFPDSKSLDGLEVKASPSTAGSATVAASPFVNTASYMPQGHQNETADAGKRSEEADDQILKEVSKMVKLINSRIATLEVPHQAFNAPSAGSRMTRPSQMNLYSIPKIEADNPFVQTQEKLVGARMSSQWDESTRIANPTSQQSQIFPKSNPNGEADNPVLQTKETLVKASLPDQWDESSKVVDPTSQQNQIFFNSRPVIRLPISTPSLAPYQITTASQTMRPEPEPSHTLAPRQSPAPNRTYIPSQGHCPAPSQDNIINPRQSSVPAERWILNQTERPVLNRTYIPRQEHSPAYGHRHFPCQRQSCTNVVVPEQIPSGTDQGHKVKNLVKRLESLTVSPGGNAQGTNPIPTYDNGFSVSLVPIESPPEKENKQRHEKQPHGSCAKDKDDTPSISASSVSTRNSKPQTELKRNQSGKSTRGAKIPPKKSALIDSKLIRSGRYSSDYSNGSSLSPKSVSSSSSWTSTQQSSNESESDPDASQENSYSSDSLQHEADSPITPGSEYSSGSDEAKSLSTSQDTRRRCKAPSLKRGHGGHSVALPKEKPISRLKKMKDKLGFIFHHHHHHHHHHHDENEKKPTKSMWKNIHSIVVRHPKEKAAAKKNSREPADTKSKSLVKKKKGGQQGGHNLHSLIDGFLKHVRDKKKKKSSSDHLKEIRRPTKNKTKVLWWKAVKHHKGFASKKRKLKAVKMR